MSSNTSIVSPSTILVTLLILILSTAKASSDITKQIINTLAKSNNYEFRFTQNINKKKETGKCILLFNRKINCKYDNSGKILISDVTERLIKGDINCQQYDQIKAKGINEPIKHIYT